MPSALPIAIREEIISRRENGETFRRISQDMNIAYPTVRQIWQHKQKHGYLHPNYHACRPPHLLKPQVVYDKALEMRRLHPTWGALMIRIHLLELFDEADVPHERTLQLWFKREGIHHPPRQVEKKNRSAWS